VPAKRPTPGAVAPNSFVAEAGPIHLEQVVSTSKHRKDIASDIKTAGTRRTATAEREERERRQRELCQRFSAAFEPLLALLREPTVRDHGSFLKEARAWVTMGGILHDCDRDRLMQGRCADFLNKLRGADVLPISTAASLLLQAQREKPKAVAQSLATCNREPTLRDLGTSLAFIREEFLMLQFGSGGVFSQMPEGVSKLDLERVQEALGYKDPGADLPSSTVPGNAPADATRGLNKKAIEILKALGERPTYLMDRSQLAGKSGWSERTLSKWLKIFLTDGLVETPHGEKSGFRITKRGLQILDKLPPQ
jgi:hypothetical protein